MKKKMYFVPRVEEIQLEPTGIIMTSIPDPFAPAPSRGDVIN